MHNYTNSSNSNGVAMKTGQNVKLNVSATDKVKYVEKFPFKMFLHFFLT